MARGRTRTLLYATSLAGAVEVALLLLALRMKRIDMVAAAVLIAYVSQAIVYLPSLRRNFSVGLGDILANVWPVIPALGMGWFVTSLLPNSFGTTFLTLGIRGIFTVLVVGLTHGLCSRFRCFHQMSGMISQNSPREVPIS
jgi:hypothetical protein